MVGARICLGHLWPSYKTYLHAYSWYTIGCADLVHVVTHTNPQYPHRDSHMQMHRLCFPQRRLESPTLVSNDASYLIRSNNGFYSRIE